MGDSIEWPDLPKRLHARIRSCYARTQDARNKVAYIEAKMRDVQVELDDFVDDPQQYALMHYPSIADPESYPVITRIGRLKDWLDDKKRKFPSYIVQLEEAENLMFFAEQEVRSELAMIRPNTPGRVPWPDRPKSIKLLRVEEERSFLKARRSADSHRVKRLADREERARKREEAHRKFMGEIDARIYKKAETMSPGGAAAYVSFMEVLKERLFGGGVTVYDLHVDAGQPSMALMEIMQEAERRAIARLTFYDY